MPIRPYLQGQAFDPDTVRVMGAAFENACKELGIVDKHDAVTRIVARTVIDLLNLYRIRQRVVGHNHAVIAASLRGTPRVQKDVERLGLIGPLGAKIRVRDENHQAADVAAVD